MAYTFNEYLIEFDPNTNFSIFDEGEFRGIHFTHGTMKYEVLNCVLGERLLINCSETYYSKDLPFNLSTAHFLPLFVKVRKLHEQI